MAACLLPTRIKITADPSGRRASVVLSAGQVAPRLLSSDGSGARVALVSTSAMLLSGDDVRLEISVGPGAWLELVDVAAVVAYDARGGQAAWSVDARVAERGRLTWHGEPMVVSSGADVVRRLRLDVEAGGRALLRETCVLGRSGEIGGSLSCSTRIAYAGRPLLVEDLDLRRHNGPSGPGLRESAGVLGSHRVLDTVTLVGGRTAPTGVTAYQLAGLGTVLRHLGSAVHQSPMGRIWPSCLPSRPTPGA